jgi:hypothetical protein
MPSTAVRKRLCRLALVGVLALSAAGCGSSAKAPAGLTISGPGLQTSKPPWPPEYAHLAQRLRTLGLPPGGKETFHIHALLHIYVDGLLVPTAANIGLDPAKKLESSLHTHDRTGIVHMEAPHPYKYTLGDFFSVWGVKFGPDQLGGLRGYGGNHLHFYLDGHRLSNPAAHVLHNNDRIVVGYGADNSFPHNPSSILLKEVEGKGGAALSCSKARPGQHAKSCLTTRPQSSPSPTTSR